MSTSSSFLPATACAAGSGFRLDLGVGPQGAEGQEQAGSQRPRPFGLPVQGLPAEPGEGGPGDATHERLQYRPVGVADDAVEQAERAEAVLLARARELAAA